MRGIHFADVPRGQAKYVTAMHGSVIDYIIDVRVGSPTFGEWDSVLLDEADRKAVYLSEGLGHAFVALTPEAAVSYLVSGVYDPVMERGVTPLDTDIALRFPDAAGELLLSPKDLEAPSLSEALEQGILPSWSECLSLYTTLNREVD